MKPTKQRRVPRVLFVLSLVLLTAWAAFAALGWWAGHALRDRIREAAGSYGANWVDEDGCEFQLDLWSGDLLVTGLRWEPGEARSHSGTAVSGVLDTLRINGLSYRALFLQRRLRMDALCIRATGLMLQQERSDPLRAHRRRSRLEGIEVADLQLNVGPSTARTKDSIIVRVEDLSLAGSGIVFDVRDTSLTLNGCDARLIHLRVDPFVDSTLAVERVDLNNAAQRLELSGIHFGPKDASVPAKALAQERDVVAGSFQRIVINGIDLRAVMRGAPHACSVRVGPAELTVARDKSRPDPAFRHKPLPQRLLRSSPIGSGFDSLIIEQLSVHYHERVDPARGFAFIPFDGIQGVLTNVHHRPTDSLRVKAEGFVFGRTPLSLDLGGLIGDTTDQLAIQAHVGHLPFPALNRVLQPLTGVATPEGRLDTLILRMRGGDRTASASCWMRYDGLRLDVRSSKAKKEQALFDPVFDALLNAVVRRDRMGRRKGDGWVNYTWERRRDRAVFNYLWAGVREGAKASMLPGVVLDITSNKSGAGGK